MSPRAQTTHGFLIENDMSLWASGLADFPKSVRHLTAELEATDRDFDAPIAQHVRLTVALSRFAEA